MHRAGGHAYDIADAADGRSGKVVAIVVVPGRTALFVRAVLADSPDRAVDIYHNIELITASRQRDSIGDGLPIADGVISHFPGIVPVELRSI
jgi:hypothetical protein